MISLSLTTKSPQIVLLIVALVTCLFFVNLTPSIASIDKAKPTPTITAGLAYKDIERAIDSAGNAREREAYFKTIKGARIHWTAEVRSYSNNDVMIKMNEGLFWLIYLKSVLSNQAPEDATIEFEGTIDGYSRFIGLNSLYLKDVTILNVTGGPPTPTSRPSATSSPTLTSTATRTATPTLTPTVTPASNLTLGLNSNLRVGPGQNFFSTKQVQKGTQLAVYGRNEKGDWLLVDPVNGLWVQSYGTTLTAPIESLPLAPTLTPTPTKTPIPTRTPIPTKTPWPSPTPIPAVNLHTIYNNFEKKTSLQFKEYTKQIAGKPVREIVKIGGVQDNGKVVIHGDWSPIIFNVSEFCVVVTGVPKDEALRLDAGDSIFLQATINGIVGNYNYYYNCKNTLLLTFKKFGI